MVDTLRCSQAELKDNVYMARILLRADCSINEMTEWVQYTVYILFNRMHMM